MGQRYGCALAELSGIGHDGVKVTTRRFGEKTSATFLRYQLIIAECVETLHSWFIPSNWGSAARPARHSRSVRREWWSNRRLSGSRRSVGKDRA